MADVRLTPLESELVRASQQAKCSPPCWAYQFAPPIPLVGPLYVPGHGLMVYASAENLTWMHPTKQAGSSRGESFHGDTARVRHQHQYQNPELQDRRFFPDVGMAPVNNGGLLCAAWFVLHHCHGTAPSSPAELLRNIAVANWGKFAVNADKNVDYAGDLRKLRSSVRLVEIELAVLRPKILIMPKTILRHGEVGEAMRGASPETRIVGVVQFNATVVNTHLDQPEFNAGAAELRSRYASTPLAAWMSKLRRVNRDHAWRFLAHLAEELRPAR